jgi:alpha-ketoglutarate-dependent taurine dioxygenase
MVDFSESKRLTPSTVLLAALTLTLRDLCHQSRFLVGAGVAARCHLDLERVVGFLVNLVLVDADLSGDPPRAEVLERTRQAMVDGLANAHLPFRNVLDTLRPERTLSHTPFLSVVFVSQNQPRIPIELPDVTLAPFDLDIGTTRFDLTLFVTELETRPRFAIQYSTDLFRSDTISRIAESYLHALADLIRPDVQAEVGTARTVTGILSTPPRPLPLSSHELVDILPFPHADAADHAGRGDGPVILTPRYPDFDAVEWVADNKAFLESLLLGHGAVMLRQFDVTDTATFHRLVQSLCDHLLDDNGELPRLPLGPSLYTAVDYPADESILWHNENAFYAKWPLRLWFCCLEAPFDRGATPVVDGREMLSSLPRAIADVLEAKGLTYIRNYRDGLGLDWRSAFQTTDRHVVERRCAELGVHCEWSGDDLRTRSRRPAVAHHPLTREKVWFNQITHWHPACLPAEVRRSLDEHYQGEEMPRSVTFGDGTALPDDLVLEICRTYARHEVFTPWERGDVLMIDNMLVAHSRQPFSGPRRLAIAMGYPQADGPAISATERLQ